MAIQDLTASLDLKQNLNIYATCKQFDDLILELNIYDNSLQADLSNYDVRLKALKADKVPLIQQHIGITINSNIVNIEADEQLTTTSGKTLVELQFINKTTGKKKAAFNLVLIVVPSILEVNATISKSTYTLLEELENKLDQASDFFENIDNAINANNELKDTITDSENAKTNLDGSISTGNTSKIALDTSNTNATNTKNVLDALKTSADNTKNALNTVNQTGQTLLNSLESFENQHADVSDISNKLASVNTQLSEMAIYIIPEMFGVVGDGITDDSVAIQNAINSAQLNNACLKFNSKKTYLVNATLNITKRIKIDFNYAKIICNADWLLAIGDTNSPYACDNTDICNLYINCVNGIKMNCKRSQIHGGRINNTGIAIKIETGYENIIHDLNLGANGGASVGIDIETSDCIVGNVTGYGEHTFIINKGYNKYNNIHAWVLDSDYVGSVFFYDKSDVLAVADLDNVYSDTYETAFRLKGRPAQPQFRITNSTCAWSGKSSGYLFYNEDTSTSAQYIVDIRLDSKPTTFYLGNVDGIYSFKKYFTAITPTPNNSYSYVDGSTLRITDGRLFGTIAGSVNTGSSQTLNIKIPNMASLMFPYVNAVINNAANNIVNQYVPLSVNISGNDIILTGTFPTVSGYTLYKLNIDAMYRYY